jgi:hypothetical protein
MDGIFKSFSENLKGFAGRIFTRKTNLDAFGLKFNVFQSIETQDWRFKEDCWNQNGHKSSCNFNFYKKKLHQNNSRI